MKGGFHPDSRAAQELAELVVDAGVYAADDRIEDGLIAGLPSLKLGRNRRVPKEDLLAYLRNLSNAPSSASDDPSAPTPLHARSVGRA